MHADRRHGQVSRYRGFAVLDREIAAIRNHQRDLPANDLVAALREAPSAARVSTWLVKSGSDPPPVEYMVSWAAPAFVVGACGLMTVP